MAGKRGNKKIFDVDVPEVDIDISKPNGYPVDEDKEETDGGYVAVGGNLKAIYIRKVEPSTRFGNAGVQIWRSNNNLEMWTSPAKTSKIMNGISFSSSQLPKTIYVEGISPGTTYIRAQYTPPSGNGTAEDKVKITVIKVELDDDLWWFAGKNPGGGYHIKTIMRATPVTQGTFKWDVTDGQGKINLSDGVVSSDSITLLNINSIWIKSTSGSSDKFDTSVAFTYNGIQLCNIKLTIRTSWKADLVSGPIDSTYIGTGFETIYWFRVLDQFGTILPFDLPINEDFDTWTSDWSGENWDEPEPNSTMTGATQPLYFCDKYHKASLFSNPITVPPYNSHANEKVQHATQYYRAGTLTTGQGVLIKSHTLQYYRGKGRQL